MFREVHGYRWEELTADEARLEADICRRIADDSPNISEALRNQATSYEQEGGVRLVGGPRESTDWMRAHRNSAEKQHVLPMIVDLPTDETPTHLLWYRDRFFEANLDDFEVDDPDAPFELDDRRKNLAQAIDAADDCQPSGSEKVPPPQRNCEIQLPTGKTLSATVELQTEIAFDGIHVVPERDARPDEAMVLIELRNAAPEEGSVAVDVLARDADGRPRAYENTSVFDIPPGGRGIARVWITIDDATTSIDVLVKPEG